MKAIETQYAGCRFRSRLEARWAVLFDALNIEWQYEPEGFELPSGRYLPDFYLPEYPMWLEVKGRFATRHERQLLEELESFTRHGVRIAEGDIPRKPTCTLDIGTGDHVPLLMLPYPTAGIFNSHRVWDMGDFVAHTHLQRALDAARSARFEHGEMPNVKPVDPWRRA